MRNYFSKFSLLATLSAFSLTSFAQSESVIVDTNKNTSLYNVWSLELDAGMAKPVRPFGDGYFMLRNSKYLGIQINHFGLGVRHMLNPIFGFKTHLSFDRIHNFDNSLSKEFNVYYTQLTIEGVVNARRLFQMQNKLSRWGLLMHGGFQICSLNPDMGPNQGESEFNMGMLAGLTPQFRLTDRISIFYDVVAQVNVTQHYNWDGTRANNSENKVASILSNSVGLSISLGKNKMHGDFADIPNSNCCDLSPLEIRIAKLEAEHKDDDNDGVPNYIDIELNTKPGALVNVKGETIDFNNNRIPDDIEEYFKKLPCNHRDTTINNKITVKEMINNGYVAAYFEFNESKPTDYSTSDIALVYRYMKNNLEAQLEVIGYADIFGSNEYNKKLSLKRAEEVKKMLVKGGIDEKRISVNGESIDNSVDKNDTELTRRMIRRVYFKVK